MNKNRLEINVYLNKKVIKTVNIFLNVKKNEYLRNLIDLIAYENDIDRKYLTFSTKIL